jgi:hypothetical protein
LCSSPLNGTAFAGRCPSGCLGSEACIPDFTAEILPDDERFRLGENLYNRPNLNPSLKILETLKRVVSDPLLFGIFNL